MTLTNAIKKLSKYGEVKKYNGIYTAVKNGVAVEFMRNGRLEDNYPICAVRVYGVKDKDDNMTDYSAGIWCKTLTKAIKQTELFI